MPELHATVHDLNHILEVCSTPLASKGEHLVVWHTIYVITEIVAQLVCESWWLGIRFPGHFVEVQLVAVAELG